MVQNKIFLDKVMVLSLMDLIHLDESNFNFDEYVIISFKDEIHDHLDILDKYKYLEIEFDDIKKCNDGQEKNVFPFGPQIAEFVIGTIKNNKKIICQCVYGNSRSAGCAAAILEYLYKQGSIITDNSNFKYNQIIFKCVFDELTKYSNH